MIAFLVSTVIFFASATHAGGTPNLIKELPTLRGCEALLNYSLPGPRIEKLSSSEAADELVDLLSLTHPLVILYLRNTDLHGDVRLLSLLWGDQQMFDLRRSAFLGKKSLFEVFLGRLRFWKFKDLASRVELATELLAPVSAIEWSINYEISGATIYVTNHKSETAFRTDRLLWMADFPRHWDVNDGYNIALRLHETIYALRMRIRQDPSMAARLKLILAEKLPTIMRPTSRFLKKYEAFLDGHESHWKIPRNFKRR